MYRSRNSFYLSKNIDPLELQTLLSSVIKEEKGNRQFEVNLSPSTNIIEYIGKISRTKYKIQIIAKQLRGHINFSAKPFSNDYGSSMHFHINFIASSVFISEELLLVQTKQSTVNGIAKPRSAPNNPHLLDCFVATKATLWNDVSSLWKNTNMANHVVDIDLIGQNIYHYMLDSFFIFTPNENDYLR